MMKKILNENNQDPTDRISLLCAYLALLPQALCITYATLTIFTREVEIALLFGGQLSCEALNLILKRTIKEHRPATHQGKGYGMPSSHAQFLSFWATSLSLFLLLRHRPRGPHAWSPRHRACLSLVALSLAALTAWSRAYLGYHSPRQVVVGCLAGGVFALFWFRLTSWVRCSGVLEWALGCRVARALRVRDLVVYEDLCQAGWEKWERARAKNGVDVS